MTLAVIMPERNFRRPAGGPRRREVLRSASATLGEQVHSASGAVRAVPGLVLVFAMTSARPCWRARRPSARPCSC